ncbi:hypothetical protein [Phaffia rhodozyma]|uniref:Uncharacterized protein n=1 Tax=Phaffia rhodozyma TaxID=264483 RepID=A0A0F7SVT9_PHARH|nr:hypothetical protein [Phaffia rhodozyma]
MFQSDPIEVSSVEGLERREPLQSIEHHGLATILSWSSSRSPAMTSSKRVCTLNYYMHLFIKSDTLLLDRTNSFLY